MSRQHCTKQQNNFLFGLCNNNWTFISIIIIGAIFLLGEDLIELIFCNDMTLIWVVLLFLLLMNFDDGCGCR